MPPSKKQPRVRVEHGLHRQGDTWYASAVPAGERRERFKSLGRRLRDDLVVGLTAKGMSPVEANHLADMAEQMGREMGEIDTGPEVKPETTEWKCGACTYAFNEEGEQACFVCGAGR